MTEETKNNGLNEENEETQNVQDDKQSQSQEKNEKKSENKSEKLVKDEEVEEVKEQKKEKEKEEDKEEVVAEKKKEKEKKKGVSEAKDELTKEEPSKTKDKIVEEEKEVSEIKEEIIEEKEEPQKAKEETVEEKKDSSYKKSTTTAKTPKETSKPKEEEILKPRMDPLTDFNWDLIGKKEQVYSKEERENLEKLYDETLSAVQQGEVVEGTIAAMNKREVVVNIGYKSEGVINANEFRYEPDTKVGDKVEVFVENIDSGDGQLLISHNKAKSLKAWDRINEVYENNEIIKGYIKCRTKGGMIVDVFGIEAFLPGSQIDVKPIRDYDIFVDKTMDFKVVKINEEFKNVVVSHKALIEAELEEQKKEIIAKLEKGQVIEGVVKNITSYGVFIDLGGVDGLIHITDLSWGRVNHPEEVVKLDEKINVVILDFDDEKKRIALGYKQLTPHPWESLDEDMKIGDKVKGKVVVLADYGAFIEIKPGVEGLIHVSEMSWSQHLRSAQDFMKIDDEVEAIILTLDREERKMSLGIKQLYPDPWKDIEKRYQVNSKHTAKVRNFTNFGVFVELEEGVDGLVHISDLSWTKKIKHPAEFTSIDVDMEVVVLEIDEENRRLSLGHKQIEENPWEVFETIFTNDSIHEGTIVEVNEKGSIISLPYGVEGFATPKHLVKEDGAKAKLDEKLNFKVIEFNKDAKKIFVSHSRIHEDEERAKIAESRKDKKTQSKGGKKVKNIADKMEKTTFGDVTDLAALKKEIEEKDKKIKKDTEKQTEAKIVAEEVKDKKIDKEQEDVKEKEEVSAKEETKIVKEANAEVKEEKTAKKATKTKAKSKKADKDEEEKEEAKAKKKKTAAKKKKTEKDDGVEKAEEPKKKKTTAKKKSKKDDEDAEK